MSSKNISIEELYGNAFSNEHTSPPEFTWSGIETKLNEASIDNTYKKIFEKDEITPPSGLWLKIQTKLMVRDFFRFQLNKVNVYYVAALSLLLGIGFNLPQQNNEPSGIAPIAKEIERNNSLPEETTNSVSFENQSKNIEKQESAILALNEKPTTITKNEVVEPIKIKNEVEQEIGSNEDLNYDELEMLNPLDYVLFGRQKTCVGNECVYSLKGTVNKETAIKWNIPSNASLVDKSEQEIRIVWNKEGINEIEAVIENKKGKRINKKLSVAVDKPETPGFKGKTEVCQGVFDAPYAVSNDKDLGKQYIWQVKKNPYTPISNGYMKVNWQFAGLDTIILTDINLVNQCKSEISIPILVKKQPEGTVSASMTDVTEYKFEFSGHTNGFKYVWQIDNVIYDDAFPTHKFEVSNTYDLKLEVTDLSKCKAEFKSKINVTKHFLRVPTTYFASDKEGYKADVSSPLSKYRIEIFNPQNERIWESSLLNNGYPAEGWDGTVDGVKLQSGKYVCRINAVFEDGTVWQGFTKTDNKIEFTLIETEK